METSDAKKTQDLTSLVLAIFQANGQLIEWGDRLVAPLGLTSARWQMLGAIALASRPRTAPQIADAMGVSRQGAQKQLNLLLADGLVEQHPNPGHQRSPFYQLTERGQELYARTETLWQAKAQAMAAVIPARDLKTAGRVLAALCRQLAGDHPGEST